MVFKPRVLLGFHPNPRLLESRIGKTLMVQENMESFL